MYYDVLAAAACMCSKYNGWAEVNHSLLNFRSLTKKKNRAKKKEHQKQNVEKKAGIYDDSSYGQKYEHHQHETLY